MLYHSDKLSPKVLKILYSKNIQWHGKMFMVFKENTNSNSVKCECMYVLLSIWKNMVDAVAGLN